MRAFPLIVALIAFVSAPRSAYSADPIELETLRKMRSTDYFAEPKQVALAQAIEAENPSQILAAIKAGADVNFQGHAGMRPLFWSMAKQRPVAFRLLLENGADPNITAPPKANDERIVSVMELCAIAMTSEYLQQALAHGGNPNTPVGYANRTIIFETVLSGRNENLEVLLKVGADISRKDDAGETPMMAASSVGNYHAVYMLLKNGADPKAKNRWDATLLTRICDLGARIPKDSDQYPWYIKVHDELKSRGLLN